MSYPGRQRRLECYTLPIVAFRYSRISKCSSCVAPCVPVLRPERGGFIVTEAFRARLPLNRAHLVTDDPISTRAAGL